VPRDAPPAQEDVPRAHVRTIVIQPVSPLGKLALAAGLVAAGVLLVTVGFALVAGLAAVAAITGVGVVAYRALTGARAAPPPPGARLDPSREVFLPKEKS